MGFVQLDTCGRIRFVTIGARNTVPSSAARIVPFGLFHMLRRLYSSMRCWFGVIVAHFTPTCRRRMASAASCVMLSSVSSRQGRLRSKHSVLRSTNGVSSVSLIMRHSTRVISSPSSSAIAFFIWIIGRAPLFWLYRSSSGSRRAKSAARPPSDRSSAARVRSRRFCR